jgi:tRNA nucleotidyltransferase/poly(A) polymerase
VKITIPGILREFAAVFAQNGKKAYLVGGAVRDMVLGMAASDYDVATDATPQEVSRMFRTVIPTGIKHGTVTVRFKGRSIEVTVFRTEGVYSDGRRPDAISYAPTIEADLSRRDFTMNAMALELPSGALIDPYGGRDSLKQKYIRCVGRAAERFLEDGLRPLRAVRFSARLGFNLDSELLDAIPAALSITAKVSAERVRLELEKTVMSRMPCPAFLVMEQTGLLKLILPELAACRGVEQRGFHTFDVLDHSLYALEWAAANDYPLAVRLAALFHDIGKPRCARFAPAAPSQDGLPEGGSNEGSPGSRLQRGGFWTFYNHEKESERLCRALMERLRWPNAVMQETAHLVKEHMFHYEPAWNDGAVRRFIARAGEYSIEPLFMLRRADTYGFARRPPPPDLLLPFSERIEQTLAKSRALSLKDLAINGNDLLTLGIHNGRRIGILLCALLDAVMTDPSLNTREKLLEIAAKMEGLHG